MSIYDEDTRLERVRNSLRRSSFSDATTDKILAWGDHRLASGNKPNSVYKTLYCLCTLADHVDFDFTNPTQAELQQLVRALELDDIQARHGGTYSPQTKSQIKIAIRSFQHWCGNDGITDFIDTGVDKSEQRVWRKSDFVEADDMPALLDATTSSRDHLLLQTLWLSGGRIGEVLPLAWGDITRTDDLVQLRFRQSKSEPRIVHAPAALWDALEDWRSWCPDTASDAYIFTPFKGGGGHLSRAQAAKIIDKAVDAADVDKDLTPHDFRRGRATYLAEQGWNEPKLMQHFGWSDPDTPQRYIWLADADLAAAVKALPES